MMKKLTLFLLLSLSVCAALRAQSSENFDEVPLTDGGNVSKGLTNPRIIGSWTIGLLDASGAYTTNTDYNYVDVTNNTFAQGGTNLADGANDKAASVTGELNVAKYIDIKSTNGGKFKLNSFAFDAFPTAWTVTGYSGGVQVVSQNFTTLSNTPNTLQFTAPGWSSIDEFRISQQNGASDIYLVYLDDINVGQPQVTTTAIQSISRTSPPFTNASTVTYTATFSSAVTGLSASNFSLSTTAGQSNASIGSVSGSGTTYTIVVNTGSGDGTLTLNLANAAGLSPGISTTLPFSGDQYTVDKTAPAVTSVSTPPDGNYGTGTAFQFVLTFSEPAQVNTQGGTPRIALTIGSQTRYASYVTGSGTFQLIFLYAVQPGDLDLDGIQVTPTLLLNGGTMTDGAGNNANPALNNLPGTQGIIVDAVAPSVTLSTTATSPVQGPFTVKIVFSQPVTGLTAGDITAANATVTNLQSTDQTTYTALVTPTTAGQQVSVSLPASSATNITQMGNTASNTLTLQYTMPSPVIGNLSGDNVTYTEGAAPVILDKGDDATLTDEGTGSFSGGNLTVSITGAQKIDQDVLGIQSVGTGAGEISASGSSVSYGGAVIGVVSGGANGNNLVVSFSANASTAAAQALIRSITYNNTSLKPNTDIRTVSFTIADANSQVSDVAAVTVNVTAVNSRPQATRDTITVLENTPGTGNVLTNDNDPDGNALTSSLVTAPVNGTVVLNADGSFTYTPNAFYAGTDSLIYQVCDNGSPSLCDTSTLIVLVQAIPPPVVTTTAGATNFTAGSAPVTVDPGVTVQAQGYSTLDAARVSITNPYLPEDNLNFVNDPATMGSIQGTYNSLTGVMTLVSNGASATVDQWQAALQSVQYQNTSPTPHTATRNISFSVSVGPLASADATKNVTINIPNNNAPVITPGQSWTIDELSANGTAVGIVAATDADGPTTFSAWTITAGNTGGAFAIDASSGEITVADGTKLDYGTAPSYTLTLTVSDGTHTSASQTVTVNLNNVNNHTPVITPGQSWSIDENSANGTAVGTVAATDADGPTTFSAWTITAGNTGGAFAIDASTGKITVADGSKLDYNTTPSYTLTLTVSDGTNTSAPQTVQVNINNVNSNPPVITPGQSWSIDENSANGTAVGTVAATDADGPTTFSAWTITAGNTGGAFTIDASTGKITVADGSKLDYNTTPSYTLTLTVSDGTNTSASQTVKINLNNINNNLPVITPGQSWSIDENSANGTAVGMVAATDADGPTTFSAWTITAGNTGGAFAIDASTGKITVADGSKLDYNTTPSYTLTLTVSDGTNTSASQTVKINLNNINNNPPVITPGQSWSIDENSANGTAVGTVAATDADGPTTFSTWTITAGNTGSPFAIDASSGKITVADGTKLDYGTTPSYTLTLTVSDGVNTSAPQTVQINLNNINNNPPVITPGQSWSIDENSANGTAVGTVAATDADGPTTFSTWTITAGNTGSPFAIDASSGKITVADGTKLDYGTTPSYTLTLTVSDGVNTSAPQTVQINLNNINNNPPVITPGQSWSIDENSANGTAVGTVAATDADGPTTFSAWTITSGNTGGAFAIDASSGKITVADGSKLDYSTTPSYTLTLTVSDGTNTSAPQTVKINLNNINNNPPVITPGQSWSIDEGSANGTAVGTVAATDADGPTTFSAWTITAGNTGNAFAIDASSGKITVADGSKLDYNTSPSYTLTLTVSDGVNTSAPQTVKINLNNINNNPPVITPGQSWSLDELSANGTAVSSVAATDADGATTFSAWTITAGNTGNAFAIDASTGKISVADGSKLDYGTTPSFTLTLTVSDGVNTSAPQTVKINLNNINNNPPVITPGQSWTVDENSANGTAVGMVAATDADGPTTFSNWSIAAGNTGSAFTIDASSGKISVADGSKLDYETLPSYTLTLTVSDGVNTSQPQTVTVNLKDVHEAPTDVSFAPEALYENQPAKTLAGKLSATSEDAGSVITYSLVTGTGDDDNGSFQIDGASLVTSAPLDYEKKSSYKVRVRASTQYGLYIEKAFTIDVLDVNEAPTLDPVSDQTLCYTTDEQQIKLKGITAGEDKGQTTTVTVAADHPEMFSDLSVSAGKLSYSLQSGASGSAVVTVTVTDDGGVEHGGIDQIKRNFTITVNPLPAVTITAADPNPVSKGIATRLTASGAQSYQWDNGPGIQSGWNDATLVVRPQQDATYTVTGTSDAGCSVTQEYALQIVVDYKLICNNILTPNGDGKNDRWVIQNIDSYPVNQVKVFDRSGRVVYQKSSYNNDWKGMINGSPLATGTYYYIFIVDGGKKIFKGYIEILHP